MPSVLDKLVQRKRYNMLVLGLLLVGTIFIERSNGINLTYIVKKESQRLEPSCIADENERYAAIGWIYGLTATEVPKITTKFVPTIHNDYNCKFSKSDKCRQIWSLKNWQIDENSTRTLDLIFDDRWQDFPEILTDRTHKEFEERVEIPVIFKAGFSVRALGSVEVLLCEGWDPYAHSCYHLNITLTNIFLRKYHTLPKNASQSDKFLDNYLAFANILSDKEWRNFVVELDEKGVLSLTDINLNRTVIQYVDNEPLKPIYLMTRSPQPALWRIHQNHFMYTKLPQTSRLGPVLNLPSRDLCVTLYVSTCSECEMSFFLVKDSEKKFLIDVKSTQNQWRLIKLKDDHISVDKINIFVETRFAKNVNQSEGFWAIDDVRVCHENEVKVSFLKLPQDLMVKDDSEMSCQLVQYPKWRPKKLIYSKIVDFPDITKNPDTTSISLNWTQEDPNNQINYFITYAANEICSDELPDWNRIKSNGFLMTKHNEIKIENLIPFTKYNITFSSMLHENAKDISVTTKEKEQPSLEELPSNLNVQVTDTEAFVSWDKIKCAYIYGTIQYQMSLQDFQSNKVRNITVLDVNSVTFNDLQPYTRYCLTIQTGRQNHDLTSEKEVLKITSNFTTRAGKAPRVENLELYSYDSNSASFRFNLPNVTTGTPVSVQIERCNALSFKKCKLVPFPLARCKLWNNKYCVDLNNLIPAQKYNFKVSLKNADTPIPGVESLAQAFMQECVPASPTNLTYHIVDCKAAIDYCHLNISWLHPYDQNGTISSFHIVLNATDPEDNKDIQEILNIYNSSYYQPKYNYQIKFIPYSTHYELYVQSVNLKYKSNFAHTHVKTEDLGDHIDQSPTLIDSEPTSLTFKLPLLDPRLESYRLTTIVQDFNKDKTIPIGIRKKMSDQLCQNFGNTWMLDSIYVNSTEPTTVVVGNNGKPLEEKTKYCLTFIVTNFYKNTQHDVVYYKKVATVQGNVGAKAFNHLYVLLILLLIIPIAFLVYRYVRRRKIRNSLKHNSKKDNVYESLPFEECEENCVHNQTYDQLLHK